MLIDEAEAPTKFCPFQRGAFQTAPGSGKFAAGVNVSPNGPLTHCIGSRCMLWETVQVRMEEREVPCKDCDGKGLKDCKLCGGTGKHKIQIPHQIGFCGAGVQFPAVMALRDIAMTLDPILKSLSKEGAK